MSIFADAVKYAQSISYGDIPSTAIEMAKRALLDYIAVTVGGCKTSDCSIIHKYVNHISSKPEAGIIGSHNRAALNLAALANGFAGHVLDYDDCNASVGHPTVVIAPVLFSAGEVCNASGKDIIKTYIISLQVQNAIARTFSREAWERGWHLTCVAGIFGATVAASLLLGLNEEQFVNAMGISASKASGIKANFGTRTKPYQVGLTAYNGATASLLAFYGINASPEAMEAPDGFYKVITGLNYQGKKPCFDGQWEIIEPGLQYKIYPSCSATHTAIETTIKLVTKHDIKVEEIDTIHVGVDKETPRMLICHNPIDVTGARFSMEYSIAAAAVLREGGLCAFSESALCNPQIKGLLSRVQMEVKDELSQQYVYTHPSIVTITLKDGRMFYGRCDVPKGAPINPLDDGDLINKFNECADSWMSPTQQRLVLDDIFNLEKVSNINEFTTKLYSGLC